MLGHGSSDKFILCYIGSRHWTLVSSTLKISNGGSQSIVIRIIISIINMPAAHNSKDHSTGGIVIGWLQKLKAAPPSNQL